MRFLSIWLWALVALPLGALAQAQNAGPERVVPDQMERGVTLSAPAQSGPPPDYTRELQTELKRVGCLEGVADGVWGAQTRAALVEFVRLAKLDVPTDAPTSAALDAVKARSDRVCPIVARAAPPPQAPQPQAKPARPQPPAEARRPARSDDSPSSGMCWRQDGRGTSLVPCSEAPGGRRAY